MQMKKIKSIIQPREFEQAIPLIADLVMELVDRGMDLTAIRWFLKQSVLSNDEINSILKTYDQK
jgi:hypothetical protein